MPAFHFYSKILIVIFLIVYFYKNAKKDKLLTYQAMEALDLAIKQIDKKKIDSIFYKEDYPKSSNEINFFSLKQSSKPDVSSWQSNFLSIAPDSIKVYHEPLRTSNIKTRYVQGDLPMESLIPKIPATELDFDKKCTFNPTSLKIFFLKTHKTASSTIQNILFRLGTKYNLKFAMPKSGNRFNYPYYVTKNNVRHEEQYNIICNHMRYQKGILDHLYYNKGDTQVLKFTILREPTSLFESTFGYLKDTCQAFIRADKNIQTFLSNPEYYYKSNEGGHHIFAHNHMLFDMGFGADLETEEDIHKAIGTMKQIFDLVLIKEHFVESIILLKHALCIENFKDFVYLVTNARDESIKYTLSNFEKQKILKWNKGDARIYNAFNATLWQKIEKFGKTKMQTEVDKLKKEINFAINDCFLGETSDQNFAKMSGQYRPSSNTKIKFFVLKPDKQNDEFCQNLSLPELKFAARILKRQYNDWNSFY